jgi:uncharacterized membrane protein
MKKIILIILIIGVIIAGVLLLMRQPERREIEPGVQGRGLEEFLRQIRFTGEKGENVILENQEIKLNADLFVGNQARFYNTVMPNGKTIYFFVLKDRQGVFRAAANACFICFGAGKGYRQEGDNMVCIQCGRRYPLEKIATERGGCNPEPINPNLEVRNGQIIIEQADLEKVLNLF